MNATVAVEPPHMTAGPWVETAAVGSPSSPALVAPGCFEEGLVFACADTSGTTSLLKEPDQLVGVLSLPLETTPSDLAVVIVVGGPQYRVGSHRLFVEVARHLAASGAPCLRFDVRGMGDSTGEARAFDQLDDDIAAALDALQRRLPQVRRVVLFGLCDGASAATLYAQRRNDARIAGFCLINPWVRSPATLAQTHVRQYYRQRLMQAEFWRKLIRGEVAGQALRDLASNVRLAWQGRRAARMASSAASAPRPSARPAPSPATPAPNFQTGMAWGLQQAAQPTLVVLSSQDWTAREFEAHAAQDPAWTKARTELGHRWNTLRLEGADHTLSQAPHARALMEHLSQWLDGTVRLAKVATVTTVAPAAPGASVGLTATTGVQWVDQVAQLPEPALALLRAARSRSVQLGVEWQTALETQVMRPSGQRTEHAVLWWDGAVAAVWSLVLPQHAATGLRTMANYYCAWAGPVLAEGCSAQAVACLMQSVAQRHSAAHSLRLHALDLQHPHTEVLRQGLRLAGYAAHDYFAFGNWVHRGACSWDAFLAARSANLRSTMRRSIKRLQQAGGTLEIIDQVGDVARGMRAFEAVYRLSWKEAEPYPAFYRELAHRLAERGELRLGVAWLGRTPIAAQWWSCVDGVAEIHKLAYDEAHKPLGAGTALTAALMERVLDSDKVHTIDYLIGDDAYKQAWMPERLERGGLVAGRWRHPRGLVLNLRQALGQLWRTRFKAVPAAFFGAAVALAALTVPASAEAQASGTANAGGGSVAAEAAVCAPVAIPGHYGPLDYLTEKSRLPLVETHHFTPDIENLMIQKSGKLGNDLSYTLNAIPNHHRALAAVMRWAQQTRSDQPVSLRYPVSCYLDRATRYRPRDAVVRGLFALYLGQFLQQPLAAAYQLEQGEAAAEDNPVTLSNLALVAVELKLWPQAQALARKTLELGYERADLMDRLQAAGQWPGAASASGGAGSAAK